MYYSNATDALFQDHVLGALNQPRNKYSIKLDRRVDEDLFIYHVVCEDGEHLEAQVFAKLYLPAKLYLARKRRHQRLRKNCRRFIAEVDTNTTKVVLCRIPGDDSELRQQGEPDTGSGCAVSANDFPALPCSEEEDTNDKLHGTWNGCHEASFAQVVSSPYAVETEGKRGGQWKWRCQRFPCRGV